MARSVRRSASSSGVNEPMMVSERAMRGAGTAMADSESGAILMAFFTSKGAIDGESTTSVKAADGVSDRVLMQGFEPKKNFEVGKFTFSPEINDADQSPSAD